MTKLLKTATAILAILLGVIGIVILSVRSRAVDPQTYKRSLAPSGIYRHYRIEIEEAFIKTIAHEEALNTPISSLILEEMELSLVVVDSANKNIDHFFNWLHQKEKQVVIHLPRAGFQNAMLKLNADEDFSTRLETAINDLDDCPKDFERKSPYPVCNNGTKYSIKKLVDFFDNYFNKIKEDEKLFDKVVMNLGISMPPKENTLPIEEFLLDVQYSTENDIRTLLRTIETISENSLVLGGASIIISFLIILILVSSGNKNGKVMLKQFSLIYLIIGFIIILISFIAYASPEFLVRSIPALSRLITDTEYAESMLKFLKLLFPILFEYSLFVGLSVFIISFLLQIISILLPDTSRKTLGMGLPEDNTLGAEPRLNSF